MKILFDHQIFTLQSYGGISRYIIQLLQGLAELGEEPRILAPFHRNHYLAGLDKKFWRGIACRNYSHLTKWLLMLSNGVACEAAAKFCKPDIFHETFYSILPVHAKGLTRVLTVHDMIHEKFSDEFSRRDVTGRLKRLAVDRADHIVCVSHSTKNDLCTILDIDADKISVVHHGFEYFDEPCLGADIAAARPYFLYVGGRGGYKNFNRFLQALACSKCLQDFDVIAFGGGRFSSEEEAVIRSLFVRPNTVRQVEGGDALLGGLYRSAAAFIFPSLYEGFGLPLLEAMAHDCPVVASNGGALPEIAGDAAIYFDPLDVEAMAAAMQKMVFDHALRDALIAHGRLQLGQFSWRKCATETRAAYRHALARRA